MYAKNDKADCIISNNIDSLAKEVYHLQALNSQYMKKGDIRISKDAFTSNIKHHLKYLAACLSIRSIVLFSDYILWLKVLLENAHIPLEELVLCLHGVNDVLCPMLAEEESVIVSGYLQEALTVLQEPAVISSSFIDDGSKLSGLTRQFLDFLLKGERYKASTLILDVVEKREIPVQDIYLEVFKLPNMKSAGYGN